MSEEGTTDTATAIMHLVAQGKVGSADRNSRDVGTSLTVEGREIVGVRRTANRGDLAWTITTARRR